MSAAGITPYAAAGTEVIVGGTSALVFSGPVQGGFIANPSSATDQGLPYPEPLYVNFIGPATLGASATTIELGPGDSVAIPTSQTTNVYINAASSGHRFSAMSLRAVLPPATPLPDTGFPPPGPTSLTSVIPAYLYQQYNDDSNVQAFINATNKIQQSYVDWYNQIGLPIYTGLSGNLLDWVATNLYGIIRPSLSSSRTPSVGPFNTYGLNKVTFNYFHASESPPAYVTSDDYYKRIVTWAFFKGDDKIFSIPWLKRRIERFINGVNGIDPGVSSTYDVSVTFGVDYQINVQIYVYSEILKEAIDAGVLELPFQFTWVITTP